MHCGTKKEYKTSITVSPRNLVEFSEVLQEYVEAVDSYFERNNKKISEIDITLCFDAKKIT